MKDDIFKQGWGCLVFRGRSINFGIRIADLKRYPVFFKVLQNKIHNFRFGDLCSKCRVGHRADQNLAGTEARLRQSCLSIVR